MWPPTDSLGATFQGGLRDAASVSPRGKSQARSNLWPVSGNSPETSVHITGYNMTQDHADLGFYRIKLFLFVDSCLLLLSQ